MLSHEEKQKIKLNSISNPCYGINIFGREFINKHLKNLSPGETVLELGTWMGGTIQFLAKNNPNLIFHTIDICDPDLWHSWYASNPQSNLFKFLNECEISNISPEDIIHIQKAHIEDYPNIHNHKGISTSLEINDISLLLIDANHTEDHVLSELEYYFPRMKKDRYIFLDDFYESQVKSAIKKFTENKSLRVKIYGDVALIYT
jgi:cephalosporin hydroxylase